MLLTELDNKYVFWDIDGVLAEYRFNNHVADPDGTSNGMSRKEIEDGVFLNRMPSNHMQTILQNSRSKNNIVLGHFISDKEVKDKRMWLATYYPMIKETIFIETSESKAYAIIKYCDDNGINLNDVMLVDDSIPILQEAERKGVRSYHISSFMDVYDYDIDTDCSDHCSSKYLDIAGRF